MTEHEKREKVIADAQEARLILGKVEEPTFWLDFVINAVDNTLALLKEQEPVEPVVDKNTSTGECEDPWGRLFFCGACGKRINEKYDPDEDDKYCKHCGQAVKWE